MSLEVKLNTYLRSKLYHLCKVELKPEDVKNFREDFHSNHSEISTLNLLDSRRSKIFITQKHLNKYSKHLNKIFDQFFLQYKQRFDRSYEALLGFKRRLSNHPMTENELINMNQSIDVIAKSMKEHSKEHLNMLRLIKSLNEHESSAEMTLASFPSYDRSALKAGILHIGVGNFHRAHQASYLDELFHMAFEQNRNWAIIGAGIMSFDEQKRRLLESQDYMQTIVEQDGDQANARIIGSMIDFIPVDEDAASLQTAMLDPKIKILSLTITEGGYFLKNGVLDITHPTIEHDIAHPNSPKSIFGMILKALKTRRELGLAPWTLLSCDNIPANGQVLHHVLIKLSAQDPEFSHWIKENIACPSSMVDRITPATVAEHSKIIEEQLGYKDVSPVFCEPYRQWVLEDHFPQGRPELERLENVQFVKDVTPYELMKIRILNGGHASLCYPAALLGLNYVHEAMEHKIIREFMNTLEVLEIIPSLKRITGVSFYDYWSTVVKRFRNPTIKDTLERICFDGSSRQPKFILPIIEENIKNNRPMSGLAIVSALWCVYCQGKTESGEDISPNDPQWERLTGVAQASASRQDIWPKTLTDIYGQLSNDQQFIEIFSKAIADIKNLGVEKTLENYVNDQLNTPKH